ncbi:MAG: hypothetical protein ACE5I7_20400, partial [Candidatus Binatia bacterium]
MFRNTLAGCEQAEGKNFWILMGQTSGLRLRERTPKRSLNQTLYRLPVNRRRRHGRRNRRTDELAQVAYLNIFRLCIALQAADLLHYDQRGQLKTYQEGIDPNGGTDQTIGCTFVTNSAGHIIANTCSPCGALDYDDACHLIGSICCEQCNATGCDACPCLSGSGPPPPPTAFPTLPNGPTFPTVSSAFSGATYSPKDELTSLPLKVHVDSAVFDRDQSITYDELGRVTSASITTNEPTGGGAGVTRTFSYDYSQWATQGRITRGTEVRSIWVN